MGCGAQSAAHAAGGHLRQSHSRSWWRCENGHEWEGGGLYQKRRRRLPATAQGGRSRAGFNDLATQSPQLARQWDYDEECACYVPADVTVPAAIGPVWWRCEKGHSWRASIHSRASGCGCPVCAGRQILVWRERPCDGGSGAGTGMGHGAQRQADPAGRSAGDREKGLVGLRAWTPLAGGGLCTDEQAKWLPILFRKTGAARLQRPCVTKSGACRTVGHGTKRNAHPAAGHADQQPQGVVDLREGTQLSGSDCVPRKRDRLPVLHKQKGARWIQRSGNRRAAHRRRVAPDAERQYSRPKWSRRAARKKVWWECPLGHVWKAAIYPRTGAKKMRLPRLRGQNKSRKRIKNTACHWWASYRYF